MSILEVQHVTKTYGNLVAVNDVSLNLEAGDNLAIIGESGCGKTTLAKIIMGLVKPDQGRVLAQPHSLQMVFQDPNQSLDPLWNVRGILNEALYRKPSTNSRAVEALEAVGLPAESLERFPHEFSGGERQRIAIARALLASPRILVLDEAVSALDTLVQKQVMDLLRKLKQEFDLTYIFISHNLRLVKNFSDKIVVMNRGGIVEQGRAQELLRSPVHPYTKELIQSAFYKDL